MTSRAITAPSHGIRAYVAGTGVTSALMGAALVAFVSVAAFVAFSGNLPLVGSGSSTQHVVLERAGAPAAAAAAAAAAPVTAAVAAKPVGTAVLAGGPAGGITERQGGNGPGAGPSGPDGSSGPGAGGQGTLPSTGPTGGPAAGVAGATVRRVDGTAARLGVNTNLSDPTQGITGSVDNTTRNLLNRAGAAVGNPHLGNDATNAVNGITGNLLGGG